MSVAEWFETHYPMGKLISLRSVKIDGCANDWDEGKVEVPGQVGHPALVRSSLRMDDLLAWRKRHPCLIDTRPSSHSRGWSIPSGVL